MSLYSQPDFTRAEAVPQRGLPVHSARALTKGGTQAQIELDGKLPVQWIALRRAG